VPSLQCQFCGAPVTIGAPIPRESECDSCRHDLRCCRNCRHYDLRYNNSCRETEADPVEDKERRNFCEYFEFNPAPFAAAAEGKRSDAARARLDQLFKGGAPAKDRAAEARARLDSLFKKPDAPSE